MQCSDLKFIYSEEAKKIWRSFHFFRSFKVISKRIWKFHQISVAFSEYMNFKDENAPFQKDSNPIVVTTEWCIMNERKKNYQNC